MLMEIRDEGHHPIKPHVKRIDLTNFLNLNVCHHQGIKTLSRKDVKDGFLFYFTFKIYHNSIEEAASVD